MSNDTAPAPFDADKYTGIHDCMKALAIDVRSHWRLESDKDRDTLRNSFRDSIKSLRGLIIVDRKYLHFAQQSKAWNMTNGED